MPNPLLATKLHVPQVRLEFVSRPRLVTRLQQGLAHKLTLISAPPGYGKTTLVCEWLVSCGQPYAWVSLDNGDNDPARFWVYVLAALQNALSAVDKNLPDNLRQHDPQTNNGLIADLINELDQLQQPLILVLDDYHLIETQSIHDGLSFLLDHAPAHFHLVVATRADPPLPLARLRARSELLEMRQADLCFTTAEAADFLNHTMGLNISPEDVARITARTEGWIAGLQMAGLSMRDADDVSGFIKAFTGSHHYIFDYLLEEVLERQSPEIRRFLLHTSILDQLTAPLCDALIHEHVNVPTTHSSDAILERLDHTNLFIIALDNERSWYRYHALFSELLRNYLGQKYPDHIPTLHKRASAWFEGQGLIADAIHHALMAGDGKRVAELISANVFALLEQNQLTMVARQLESLIGGERRARSWLWIGRAWLAAYTGKLDSVESILGAAESDLDRLDNPDDQQSLRGHRLTIRAFAAWVGGRHALAEQTAREALDYLNEADFMIRCLAATVLGLSSVNMSGRVQAFEQALVYARQCNISHITFFAHGCWAYDLVIRGRLSEALDFCEESLRLANSNKTHQPLPTLSYVHTTIALILWQRNDLNAALHHAREAVTQALQWGQADALHFAYTILGDTLFAIGAVDEAFAVLQQAWQLAHRTSRWFEEITLSQEIEWYVMQKKADSALQRLSIAQINIEDRVNKRLSRLLDLSITQVLLAQEKYDRALAMISVILERMAFREDKYHAVRVLAWQALAHHGLRDKKSALASLENAFTQAEAEGHVRSFFVAGDAFISLLHAARLAGIHPDFVDKLLTSLYRAEKVQVREAGAGSGLIEALSGREVEVVNLLAQGYPDKKIAETLFIARETVHKHLKNIYGKLGVHNRTEAVLRAKELGLI